MNRSLMFDEKIRTMSFLCLPLWALGRHRLLEMCDVDWMSSVDGVDCSERDAGWGEERGSLDVGLGLEASFF